MRISRWVLSLVVIAVALALRQAAPYAFGHLREYGPIIGEIGFQTGIVLWYFIPVVLVLSLFYGFRAWPSELGLDRSMTRGWALAFVCTLPMLVTFAVAGSFAEELGVGLALLYALRAGFVEEVFYRGFIFGQLFRRAGWGFILAGVANAVVFASAHLYQASDLWSAVGVFAITFAAALWFAWLYIEWDENLWFPIGLHVLMNFYWDVFGIGGGVLGSGMSNGARAATIALSIYLTLRMVRKRGYSRIRRGNLWKNDLADEMP